MARRPPELAVSSGSDRLRKLTVGEASKTAKVVANILRLIAELWPPPVMRTA